ncbi:MAG TPA: polysaccharide biosynthesis protein [Acetivibrio sp.]|uniref:polysaccharide biosynthesis protein n=1 Tax=Acetivibrio saccincola TaxID=1677857 RepID=UPI001691C27C|nr:polysaccharide biosynthesis protein [Acetivibrio saccincola]NLW27796.1 polysaccharide biosynthesis protein [Acetivibrio saccincola]HQA58990.1 polysaccharide biosynthesis protein [Acetivibrio sp.]
MESRQFFKDKKILIIGGTGTVGTGLVKALLGMDVKTIRVLSRDEYKQYIMMQEMSGIKNIRFLIGDVRDKERIERAMEDINIVFHIAAMKHVPSCEYNPMEAVKTNVIGTQNVITAAINNNVEKVILTSTDKTINPTNTYGATKLLAERLIVSANYYKGTCNTVFSAVRFGNVMGSRGSVIPLFKKQILESKEITVTDSNMTRFMMTLSEAVDLTLEACVRAQGGEIFVLKMPVICLKDLVDVTIEEVSKKYNVNSEEIKIKEIGLRPGEKLYEELMTCEESKNAVELDRMFVIPSLYSNKFSGENEGAPLAKVQNYSSHNQIPLTKQELKELILKEEII